MINHQLGTLMAVNLRLLNPQATTRARKSGVTGRQLTRKLVQQLGFSAVVCIAAYGIPLLSFDLSRLPGTFTGYVGLVVLLTISQSITGIFNVFFTGRGLTEYVPLPFRESDILISKLLVVIMNILPFTGPLVLVFAITAIRAGINVVVAVLLALCGYLLVLATVMLPCTLLVFSLAKLKVFQNHRSAIMTMLMGGTLLIVGGGILMANTRATGTSVDHAIITPFLPLFSCFTTPLATASLVTWGSLLFLVAGLTVITQRYVQPRLADQLTLASSQLTDNPHHVAQRRNTLGKILRAYNRQLIKEPSLLFQVIANSVLVPAIFIVTFLFGGPTWHFNGLTFKWVGVVLVAGLAYTTFTVNQITLAANLISLDRLNFDFIRALPVSMRHYLRQKFYLGYVFQVTINIVVGLIVVVRCQLPLLLASALLLGLAVGTYLMCKFFFWRDYRLRTVNWSNVTELFSRGAGNAGMVVWMLLSIAVSLTLIVVYGVAIAQLSNPTLLNVGVFLIVVVLIGTFEWVTRRGFWQRFD